MKGFFNYDGYLSKVLTKVMYIVSLNFLFLLSSILIFTAGSAYTAMYTVLFSYLKNDEPDIIKSYFRAFRGNWKKSFFIWSGMLIVLGTLMFNYYMLYQGQIPFAGLIRIFINIVLFVWMIMLAYVFPVIAYFENTITGYIKFTLGLSFAKLPFTVAVLLIMTLPVIFILFLAQYIPMAALLFLCCGVSLPAYFSGKMFLRLFRDYEGDEE
jgi:uncharacterized membrane protein YesL